MSMVLRVVIALSALLISPSLVAQDLRLDQAPAPQFNELDKDALGESERLPNRPVTASFGCQVGSARIDHSHESCPKITLHPRNAIKLYRPKTAVVRACQQKQICVEGRLSNSWQNVGERTCSSCPSFTKPVERISWNMQGCQILGTRHGADVFFPLIDIGQFITPGQEQMQVMFTYRASVAFKDSIARNMNMKQCSNLLDNLKKSIPFLERMNRKNEISEQQKCIDELSLVCDKLVKSK